MINEQLIMRNVHAEVYDEVYVCARSWTHVGQRSAGLAICFLLSLHQCHILLHLVMKKRVIMTSRVVSYMEPTQLAETHTH